MANRELESHKAESGEFTIVLHRRQLHSTILREKERNKRNSLLAG